MKDEILFIKTSKFPRKILISLLDDKTTLPAIGSTLNYDKLKFFSIYAWWHKTMQILERQGFITTERKGRERVMHLTEKGKRLALVLKAHLKIIVSILF